MSGNPWRKHRGPFLPLWVLVAMVLVMIAVNLLASGS
jgi:hypothetical protein